MTFSWRAWLRAFREASPHTSSFGNVKTGEVKRFNPRKLGAARAEALAEGLHEQEDWVELPFAESDDEYRDMTEFAMSAESGAARFKLLAALAGPKPFRAFRQVLGEFPAAAAAWQANRTGEAEARLYAFCKAWGLEFDHPQFARFAAEDRGDPGCGDSG